MEQIQKKLLNAIKIVEKDLIEAKSAEEKDKKNTDLQTAVIRKKEVLNALSHAETMADTIKSLRESEVQAKKEVEILTAGFDKHLEIEAKKAKKAKDAKGETIKVISNRRLRINGGILEYKKIAEIPNNDTAKQCLKSGLISMI